jgi:hypothetical protein
MGNRTRRVAVTEGCFEEARKAFAHWRRSRQGKGRIPELLWTMAVSAAAEVGVTSAARGLGLNHTALTRRVASNDGVGFSRAAVSPGFLEMSLPELCGLGSCVLELSEGSGVRLRVELQGVSARDLASMSVALWKGRG